MTNEQILKKAIAKAVKNGWGRGKEYIEEFKDTKNEKLIYIRPEIMLGIIFSHDFTKAFWGRGYKWFKLWSKKGEPTGSKGAKTLDKIDMKQDWEYHLQQMVLEKEPLKYLARFLK